MNENEAQALCEDWLASWTGNRPEVLLSFYADDVFYRDPGRPEGLHGREALTDYIRKLLAANPDWVWEAVEILPTEGGFCLKWRAAIPVGGGTLREEGLDIVEVTDGKIVRNEVFFDRTALLNALSTTKSG